MSFLNLNIETEILPTDPEKPYTIYPDAEGNYEINIRQYQSSDQNITIIQNPATIEEQYIEIYKEPFDSELSECAKSNYMIDSGNLFYNNFIYILVLIALLVILYVYIQ